MYTPPENMFVLLEHDPNPADQPSRQPVHWDLLIAIPNQERLRTWRLAANPRQTPAPIATERNFDHPRRFWSDEGPLRTAPGRVRRVDRGTVTILTDGPDACVFELVGTHLTGRYQITSPGENGEFSAAP